MARPVDLTEHLFRRESGRMVAALTRIFGVHNLALAEDVVQDAFCRALEVWKARGVPENPSAWLMATAKNRALDVLRRERTARTFAPELGRLIETECTIAPVVDEAFAAHAIRDQQLRMMFSCCHPRLSEEAQVALILNILCGFGAAEIASAFLTGRAAIEKRISRGKKVLASSKRLFDLADSEFASRLSALRRALYLLFNEGYHGASAESAVRVELCGEAMRLTVLLREYPPAATPTTNALAALMCLHAARLPARIDSAGDLSALVDQDRSRWDARLVADGLALLERSAAGHDLTAYHIEAAIAALHASALSVDETDWESIVSLYDRLMTIAPSPVVALNRAIAQRDGAERGIEELHAIEDSDRLKSYPFYPAAMGELELRRRNCEAARECFSAALTLARNPTERRFLEKRVRRSYAETIEAAVGPFNLHRECTVALKSSSHKPTKRSASAPENVETFLASLDHPFKGRLFSVPIPPLPKASSGTRRVSGHRSTSLPFIFERRTVCKSSCTWVQKGETTQPLALRSATQNRCLSGFLRTERRRSFAI